MRVSALRRTLLTTLLASWCVAPPAAAPQAPDLDSLRAAAEGGDADAQYELAGLYSRPDGPVAPDPAETVRWLRRAAAQGHAPAQTSLGMYYLAGEGVDPDPRAAARWWRLAAERGNAVAQYNLGVLYQGVPAPFRTDADPPVDHAEAVRWLSLAAAQDQVQAIMTLAIKYRDGDGIPQTPGEAFRWFLRASELGVVEAMGEVGSMYAAGRGVERDDLEAYRWLHLATMHSAGGDREVLLIDRETVAERLTADEIARAERDADAWTPERPGTSAAPAR